MNFIQYCVDFIKSPNSEVFKWILGFIFIDCLVKIISIIIEKETKGWKCGDKRLDKAIQDEVISFILFISSIIVITFVILGYGYFNQ